MFRKMVLAFFVATAFLFTTGGAMAGSGETVHSGTFVGASGHTTTGHAEVGKDAEGYFVKLGDDFSLDGAPAPRVGLGTDGQYAEETQLGHLKSLTGAQVYRIPSNVDSAAYNEVYIWCEKYAVPLGVAKLD